MKFNSYSQNHILCNIDARMMSKSLTIHLILLLMTVNVNSESELEVKVNNEKLVVIEGSEVNLKCTIATDALGCSFESPKGRDYP